MDLGLPQPMNSNSWGPAFNMDGLLVTSTWDRARLQRICAGLSQSVPGMVESETLNPEGQFGQIIPSIAWEQRILQVFPVMVKTLEALNLSLPYVASVSLLGVRGYCMAVGPQWRGGRLVDREHLLTDEVLIEDTGKPAGRLLRPLFDQIWNGCGWAASLNYDENGDWVQRG